MAIDNQNDIIIAMLEEVKTNMRNLTQLQVDPSKIELLSNKMERAIEATIDGSKSIEMILTEVRNPIISEHRTVIEIASKEWIFTFITMIIIIAGLSSGLYFATRPNYDRIDNDLKYRYIKMKGEASPERIVELENLFEINRDNDKIRQLHKDVEEYERAVQAKAALDEQTRLQQLEAEKLNDKAKILKEK